MKIRDLLEIKRTGIYKGYKVDFSQQLYQQIWYDRCKNFYLKILLFGLLPEYKSLSSINMAKIGLYKNDSDADNIVWNIIVGYQEYDSLIYFCLDNKPACIQFDNEMMLNSFPIKGTRIGYRLAEFIKWENLDLNQKNKILDMNVEFFEITDKIMFDLYNNYSLMKCSGGGTAKETSYFENIKTSILHTGKIVNAFNETECQVIENIKIDDLVEIVKSGEHMSLYTTNGYKKILSVSQDDSDEYKLIVV